MKQFFTALLALILVFAGIWIYDDVSGRKLHEFLGVNNVAMNIGDSSTNDNSGYRVNVTSNLGTVIDYVDYETISDEGYEIETEGFNRQFCELSIYNTETEEQLQNNSELTIGDELQINVVMPEGYELNEIIVNSQRIESGDIITVEGTTYVYVAVERIVCSMVLYLPELTQELYDYDDFVNLSVKIESDGIMTENVFHYSLFGRVGLDYYYGDVIILNLTLNFDDYPTWEVDLRFFYYFSFWTPEGACLSVDGEDLMNTYGESLEIEFGENYVIYTNNSCYELNIKLYLSILNVYG